jgi:hypothetical protein
MVEKRKKINNPNQPRYDWQKIESEYRVGTYSDAELARRYGCSRGALQKHVKKGGWKKDLTKAVRTFVKSKLVAEDAKRAKEKTGGGSKGVAGNNAKKRTATHDEEVELAADTRFQVQVLHRKDITALRELEASLIAELQGNPTKLYITQYQGDIIQQEVGLTAAERAQAANNLANVQHKRIQLERQAYNLDDDDDKGDLKIELVNFVEETDNG